MMGFMLAAAVGVLTGILTGAGVGGGTLLVLYLTSIAGVPQSGAQGINLLYFLASAPPALYGPIKPGRADVKIGLFAAAALCLCPLLGVWLSQLAGADLLRKLFCALWTWVGICEVMFKKS